jgi:hypothetical protein
MGIAIKPTTRQLASGAGPWYRETAVAAATAVRNLLSLYNVSAAASFKFVAPYSGVCLGWTVGADANITAGTLNVEFGVNGAQAAVVSYTSADVFPKASLLATPAAFAAGDALDMAYTSDAGLLTLTIITAQPILVYN